MKYKRLILLWLLLTLSVTSGCWDEKTIQDLRYLSAIGFDYVKNEYVLYAQSTDLGSVAKTERGSSTATPPATISIGKGDTLQTALDNLQKNAQVPLFSGFVSALIFHERILKKDILPAYDILNRYGLLRYTKWVFGTQEDMSHVMNSHALTGFPPLTSILHQPREVYHQRSFIEPIQFYKFISRFWEPSNTVILPNITINSHSWKENNHYISRLSIEGIHAIHRGKWEGFFPDQDLTGLRWMNPHTEYGGLVVRKNNIPKAALRIKVVKLDIEPVQKGVHPRFHVTVHLKGFVREMMGEVDAEYIHKDAVRQIKEQIRGTFVKGIQAGADLYGLEEVLYKKDVQEWKKFTINKSNKIRADALADITVDFVLSDSGKMKLKWYNYQDDLLPHE